MSKLSDQCVVDTIRTLVNQNAENSCCVTSAVFPPNCYVVAGEFMQLVPVTITDHTTGETTTTYFSLDGKTEYSSAQIVSSVYCPAEQAVAFEPLIIPFGWNGSLAQHVIAHNDQPINMTVIMPNNPLGTVFDDSVDWSAVDNGGKLSWYQPVVDAINNTGIWAVSIIQDADSTTGDQIMAKVIYTGNEIDAAKDRIEIDLNTIDDGAADRSRVALDIDGSTQTITVTLLPGA